MRPRPLVTVVGQNLGRNIRHLVFSSFGIIIGIAAFVFFWGLSQGVSKVVLHDIFPIDRVEVISPKTSLTGITVKLDDSVVKQIAARPEVAGAYPKLKLAFPAKGWGKLLGFDLRFEVGGFCDGIDPVLVRGDAGEDVFRDWEAESEGKREACGPEPTNVCPRDYYCGWDRFCHHRVPVLVSRTLVEIYNGSFAPSHGLKRIGTAEEKIILQQMKSMRFTIALGESYIGGTGNLKAKPEHVEGMLVAISDKAMNIGITVPIGYVKRWNTTYAGPESATTYSSIVVDLKGQERLSTFVPWVKSIGYEQEESQAERIALIIDIVTTLFLVIAFVICGISAVNISHVFFMIVSERRREIGLMRAIGATRFDVMGTLLAEACFVGLLGGVLGTGVAVGAARLIDYLSAKNLPDYPFKPTTYFIFSGELVALAVGFAILFCVLGAFFPARRAAMIHPARALSG